MGPIRSQVSIWKWPKVSEGHNCSVRKHSTVRLIQSYCQPPNTVSWPLHNPTARGCLCGSVSAVDLCFLLRIFNWVRSGGCSHVQLRHMVASRELLHTIVPQTTQFLIWGRLSWVERFMTGCKLPYSPYTCPLPPRASSAPSLGVFGSQGNEE